MAEKGPSKDQKSTLCLGYVSTAAVQFLGNTDNICENYHPSCAETYLIFMNKIV